jgi:hypothetical protein
VLYTIRGNQVCEGTGYKVLYTLRDGKFCKGTGHTVVYTIRGGMLNNAEIAAVLFVSGK